MGQHAFGHIEGAPNVADENIVPHLQRDFVYSAVFQPDVGGVINQNVDAPIGSYGVFHKFFNAGRHSDIHGVEAGFAPFRRDGVYDGLALFRPASAYDYLGPFRGVKSGDAYADAAGGAGDDRYFVL